MKVGLKIGLAAVVFSAVAALVFWFAAPIRSTITVAEPSGAPLPEDAVIDRLVVHNSKRTMSAYSQGRLLKTYPISLGKQPVGHKQFEGDDKTPEGKYRINERNPNSGYHKTSAFPIPTKPTKPTLRHKEKARAG